MKRITFVLVAAFVLALVAVAVQAQAGSSSVRGTVKDPQGNVVAGAAVTLSNPETNFSRTATTTDNGQFSFEPVPPGTYHVDVEAKGFKKAIITDVHALVSKPTEVGVQLEVGAVTEVVSVTAGAS